MGAFLLGITTALTHKVLAALGIGIITYGGFALIKSEIDSAIDSNFAAVDAAIYQILAMAGFIDAVGIWLGAITTIISLISFSKLGVLSGG